MDKKPMSVFGIWYHELCRRSRSKPCHYVKITHSTLNFLTDHVKIDEWHPILSALRHDLHLHSITIVSKIGTWVFQHDVDTEEKFQIMSRKSGTLWTTYAMKFLLRSLGRVLRNSETLQFLELDGLPMFTEYLDTLMLSLTKNRTLRILSLTRCRILDAGCKILCEGLTSTPNIEVLDLTGCGLTIQSAESLTKLIKMQQLDRCCEGWQNSLRYSNPKIQLMRGIKRLTLNDNPFLSDAGFEMIADVLLDDLWIKAIDVQQCGLTENVAPKILELVKCNDTLEILDARLNYRIDKMTLQKIVEVLRAKQQPFKTPEFKWYDMTIYTERSDLNEDVAEISSATIKNHIRKVQSAPLLKLRSKMNMKSAR